MSQIALTIHQLFKQRLKQLFFLNESFSELPDVRFLQKYKGKKNIYVRFSDIEPKFKTIVHSKNVSHKDPTGIYAFPLEYVLNNYMNQNINIFFSMPFISIFEDRSQHKFFVNEARTFDECNAIAKRMGFSFQQHLRALWRIDHAHQDDIRHLMVSKNTKKIVDPFIFFSTTQIDEKGTIVSGDKQRLRWLKAGYDAIEDRGGGIINIEEPYQIIFLTEDACEMIATYDKRNLIKKAEKSPLNALVHTQQTTTITDYAENLDMDKAIVRFGQEVTNKLIALILKESLFDVVTNITPIKIQSVTEHPVTKQKYIQFVQRGFGKKMVVHLMGKIIGMQMKSIQLIINISYIETPQQQWKSYRFILDKHTTIDDIVQHIYDDVYEDINIRNHNTF